jgi:hypothetical protein
MCHSVFFFFAVIQVGGNKRGDGMNYLSGPWKEWNSFADGKMKKLTFSQ